MPAERVSCLALAVAALAVAACRPGASGPNVVTVTAKDYAFDAPAEVPAGLTTFRLINAGPSLHHLQLIRLEEGKTGGDFVAALKAGGPSSRRSTERPT